MEFKCNKCKEVKKFEEFVKNKNRKRGCEYTCKLCRNKLVDKIKSKERHYNYYKKNKELILSKEKDKIRNKDFGLWRKYYSMRARCLYKGTKAYKWYGARGISVIWNSYEDFKKDMYGSYLEHIENFSRRETTLDRIDNNGNYSKENCRWATYKEQASNRRPRTKSAKLS